MQAMLDKNSLQAAVHHACLPREPQKPAVRNRYEKAIGRRLMEFETITREVGLSACDLSVGGPDQFSASRVGSYCLICVLTRLTDYPWSDSELDAIERWLRDGGSILLMSNHPPFAAADSPLASRLDVRLGGCFDSNQNHSGDFACITPDHHTDHEIMSDLSKDIVFNNSAHVYPASEACHILARLPDTPAEQGVFAVAGTVGNGRYVVCGDSGFIGNAETTYPGPGLIDRGDNRKFVMNILRWLCRI